MPTIIEPHPSCADEIVRAVAATPGVTNLLSSADQVKAHLRACPDEYAVVLGPGVPQPVGLALADTLRVLRPTLSVVMLRESVDTSVLADALRSGVREVASLQDPHGIEQAVHRAHALCQAMSEEAARHQAEETHGRILTVFSAKGGVGKTTVATNLALALANGGERQVCLVDLDLSFGDVAITLQIFPTHTIADAVPMEQGLDLPGLDSLITPYRDGVHALVAPTQPDAKETISAALVGKVLELLRNRFDYVVVDTPPAFDDQVLQAFDLSDLVVLITTPDIPALKNLKIVLETLTLLNYPREQSLLVLNRAQPKIGITAEEVSTTLNMAIAATVPSSGDIPASVNSGEPIVITDPRHPCSRGFGVMADAVLSSDPRHSKPPTPTAAKASSSVAGRKRSLFGRRSAV